METKETNKLAISQIVRVLFWGDGIFALQMIFGANLHILHNLTLSCTNQRVVREHKWILF